MSSVLFQMKQSPQVLEEVLEKVGKVNDPQPSVVEFHIYT